MDCSPLNLGSDGRRSLCQPRARNRVDCASSGSRRSPDLPVVDRRHSSCRGGCSAGTCSTHVSQLHSFTASIPRTSSQSASLIESTRCSILPLGGIDSCSRTAVPLAPCEPLAQRETRAPRTSRGRTSQKGRSFDHRQSHRSHERASQTLATPSRPRGRSLEHPP